MFINGLGISSSYTTTLASGHSNQDFAKEGEGGREPAQSHILSAFHTQGPGMKPLR